MSGDSNFQPPDTPPDGPCPAEGGEAPSPDAPERRSNEPVVDRRFDLVDGLIVVAAVAASVAAVRFVAKLHFGPGVLEKYLDPSFLRRTLARHPEFATQTALFVSRVITWLLTVWSLAFVLVRVRKPRLDLESTAWLPGSVGVWATPAGGVLGLIFAAVGGAPRLGFLIYVSAVPAAWVWLGVTRQWRPVDGWIDRSGRVLGVGWWLSVWVHSGLGMVNALQRA